MVVVVVVVVVVVGGGGVAWLALRHVCLSSFSCLPVNLRQPMRSPHLLPRGDNGTLTIGKKMYKDNGRGYDVIEPK